MNSHDGIRRRFVRTLLTPIVAALAVAAVAIPLTALPASARGSGHVPGWSTYCRYVHTDKNDPIYFFGQPGKARSHDFYGNSSTDAYSTYDSLRAGTSNCLTTSDGSAYWQPLLFVKGLAVPVKTEFDYYWASPGNSYKDVKAMPPGLKMEADRFYFTCTGKGVKAPHKNAPLDCSPWVDSLLTAYVDFPSCWDNSGNTMPSDVAYPDSKLGCDAAHPYVMPNLTMQITWDIKNGLGGVFSTGDASTFTGEFYEAWDPAVMAQLLQDCMNNGRFGGSVVNCQNQPPSIKAAVILPTVVFATDDLTGQGVNPHDPDKGQTIQLHYAWTVNGNAVGSDSSTLGHDNFGPGDQVIVTITPVDSDGMAGTPVASKPAVVNFDVVAPSPAPPGGTLNGVFGGGFGPHESVPLHLDSAGGPVLATATTDGVGAFPSMHVTLPKQIGGGTHYLFGVGGTSGIVGNGPFTVQASGTLDPGSLAAGDAATFTGGGFVPGENVNVSFPGGPQVPVVADANGTVTANLVSPEEPAPNGVVTASASSGQVTANFAVNTTMTFPQPGEPGVAMPVDVTGFGAHESVAVIVDSVDTGESITTNANGSASSTIVIPGTFGGHDVRLTGDTSGASKLTHVNLPAYVSVSPGSGPVGTNVTVSSSFGWVPNEKVTLRWAGKPGGDMTADSNGSVSMTFPVPSHDPGQVDVKLTDTQIGASPTTSFVITAGKGQNHPPSIQSASIDGGPCTNATFVGTAHGVEDRDGDNVTLHYYWTLNSSKVGSDSQTYQNGSLSAGDVLGLTIRAQDSQGAWSDPAIADPVTLKWEVIATSGQVGGTAPGVDLYCFGPSENVDIKIDSPSGTILKTVAVNASGNVFNIPVPLPWPLAGGVHTLYGVGETSDIVGKGPITITAAATLNPAALPSGGTAKANASGFVPGETVTASFPNGHQGSATADTKGSVLISLMMPNEPAPGGYVTLTAHSGSAQTYYRVMSTIVFSTKQSEPHDWVPFQITGYGPSETVDLKVDNGPQVPMFTTLPDGSLNASMQTLMTFGHHKLMLIGETSGVMRQTTMTLKAIMTVTPSTAHAGDVVTVTSLWGWTPNDQMYLYWNRAQTETLRADSNGSVVYQFTIPPVKPGRYMMKLLDTDLGQYAQVLVTVIA